MPQDSVLVELLATEGSPAELAEEVAGDLPEALSERAPDCEWRVEVCPRPPTPRASNATELLRTVHLARLREGWDLAVCLTDLPLHSGGRPVTAYVSPSHRVGLVSVPALGAVAVRRRVRDAVLRLVDALLAGRIEDLGSSLGDAEVRGRGTVRFATATVLGNLRLLVGMVRANDPTRVIARLSRALTTALGTAAIALANISVWQLSDGMTWPRLVGLTLLSAGITVLALILAHRLWERGESDEARQQIILFNLVTAVTLVLGVLALSGTLFAINVAAGGALIPPDVLEEQVGHGVAFDHYIRLAWLVSALATVGGALGSVVESDLAVREAIYRYYPEEDDDEWP